MNKPISNAAPAGIATQNAATDYDSHARNQRSDTLSDLQSKIDNKTATVGVVGLGYVGLPLISAFCQSGFKTVGFDVDQKKIDQLSSGENYLKHYGPELITDMLETERFEATADFARLSEPDAILICVPTPLGTHLEPDLTYVEKTAEAIGKVLRKGQLVVLESTTYPGTTRDIVLPRLEASGLKAGEDFFVAFSPEREDPGRKDFNTKTIPKLVGGIDIESGELAASLYRQVVKAVVPVSSCEVAEAAKLLENIYRAVNIALVNEMKVLLTAMDVNIWEVVDAAATKPFGFQPFYPGPGLGGHCIPIDPFYLTWKAREVGLPTRFIELAGQVNQRMPEYVIDRTILALNSHGKAVNGSKVLVLGLAYKPNVDDVRESPSFEIIKKLKELSANVDYNDPHVPSTHYMRHYGDLNMQSVELTPEMLAEYDCAIIATNHNAYDWQMIADNAKLIVDTRNAMANVTGPRDHITSA